MKARIAGELIAFFEKTGMTGKRLAQEANVPEPMISRLKNGQRKDILSRHADALREAMARLTAVSALERKADGGGDTSAIRQGTLSPAADAGESAPVQPARESS